MGVNVGRSNQPYAEPLFNYLKGATNSAAVAAVTKQQRTQTVMRLNMIFTGKKTASGHLRVVWTFARP